jgi:hypothetical protein
MPVQGGLVQRKCACGAHAGAGAPCDECKKREGQVQRRAASPASPEKVPPIVYDVLEAPGRPLDAETCGFFEARLGHDFSKVRVHTDAPAAESARAVNALAYTVGGDVVFGAGQYQPNATAGRQLLGHELMHVVQQHGRDPAPHQLRMGPCDDAYEREANKALVNLNAVPRVLGSGAVWVQRACGPEGIGRPSGCVGMKGDLPGEHFLFHVACDEFRPREEAKLRAFASTLTSGGSAKIHGFASEEGDSSFNENLSCARAVRGQAVVDSVLAPSGVRVSYSLFAHGATAGNRDQRRSIVIDWLPAGATPSPTPAPTPKPKPKPGFSQDCSEWHRCHVIEPLAAANRILTVALNALQDVVAGKINSGRIIDLLNVHFHDPDWPAARAVTVHETFRALQAELNSSLSFRCRPRDEKECMSEKGFVGGFTNCAAGSEITLCSIYFLGLPCDEQARVLIHEVAHHLPGMCQDFAYVNEPAYMSLPPEKAEKNPDTYAQFAKTVFLGKPGCRDCGTETQLRPGQY